MKHFKKSAILGDSTFKERTVFDTSFQSKLSIGLYYSRIHEKPYNTVNCYRYCISAYTENTFFSFNNFVFSHIVFRKASFRKPFY